MTTSPFTRIELDPPPGTIATTETVVGALDGLRGQRTVYCRADAPAAPIPPQPQITTGSRNITIGAGPSDNGTWHRAVMVAIKLNEAGLWNGTDHLTLNYPYQLHQRLFGIEHASPSDLISGQDYIIKQPVPQPVKLSLYDQQCCRDAVVYKNPVAQAHLDTLTGDKAEAARVLVAHFRRIERNFRALQAQLNEIN